MNLVKLIYILKKYFPEKSQEFLNLLEQISQLTEETHKGILEKLSEFFVEKKFSKVEKLNLLAQDFDQIQPYLKKLKTALLVKKPLEEKPKKIKKSSTPENYLVDTNQAFNLSFNTNFANKRPCAFELEGERRSCHTWQVLVVETCNLLIGKDADTFMSCVNDPKMKGNKHPYFFATCEGLKHPRKLSNDLYVDVHSANLARSIILKLLAKYKIDPSQYTIFFKADYSDKGIGQNPQTNLPLD